MKGKALLIGWLVGVSGLLAQESARMTLSDCLAIALEQNPQVVQSRLYAEMSAKDVAMARADFFPEVSVGLGYNHSTVGPSSQLRIDPRSGIPVPVQPDVIKSWASSASASLNQTLFNGGYTVFRYKQAVETRRGAVLGYQAVRQEIAYRVTERYYNVLRQKQLLEIQKMAYTSAEEAYRLSEALFEVGKVPRSDVLQALVRKNEAEMAVVEAENLLSVARASLNQVLGLAMDREIEVVDDPEIPEFDLHYEEAVRMALAHNPALRQEESALRATRHGIALATSRFLPTISAYAGYSWRNERFGNISHLLDKDYNWYTGLSLSIPLFQGFSRVAALGKAKLSARYEERRLEQTRQELLLEIKEAYTLAQQARRKIAMGEDAIRAAESNLQLAEEKYRLGSGTMLDVVNAQVSLTQARGAAIQARYEYKLSLFRLQRAMGQLTSST